MSLLHISSTEEALLVEYWGFVDDLTNSLGNFKKLDVLCNKLIRGKLMIKTSARV